MGGSEGTSGGNREGASFAANQDSREGGRGSSTTTSGGRDGSGGLRSSWEGTSSCMCGWGHDERGCCYSRLLLGQRSWRMLLLLLRRRRWWRLLLLLKLRGLWSGCDRGVDGLGSLIVGKCLSCIRRGRRGMSASSYSACDSP